MHWGSIILGLNVGLVFYTSHRLFRLFFSAEDPGKVNQVLWSMLVSIAQMVLVASALGYAGWLNMSGFLISHGILAAMVSRLPQRPAPEVMPTRNWVRQRWTALQPLERMALGCVALFGALYLATGLFGERLVHDALTYRLTRVAHWLQEGSIRHFPTNDVRINYHPINGDLITAWLLAHQPQGYRFAAIGQFAGGMLTLLATFGFARVAQYRRENSIGAVVLLFLMPCFCVQWSTCQNDLITTGLLWSGLYFFYQSFNQCRLAIPGWIGIALAIGAKGTVFYLGFGLVAATLMWWRISRPAWSTIKFQLVTAVVALLVFAAPRYVENYVHFGNPFAPGEVFAINHGKGETEWGKKLSLNLKSYALQAMEPVSNLPLLSDAMRGPWSASIEALPEADPYSNTHYPRREWLREFGKIPGADSLSSGALLPLLALIGTVLVVVRWFRGGDESVQMLLSLVLCPVLFLLFFSAMFLWWPTSFRYFNIVAPPIAILAAKVFETPRPAAQPIVWLVALLLSIVTVAQTWLRPSNVGRVQFHPERSDLAYVAELKSQRQAINTVLSPNSRVGIYLPWNQPLADFYRNENPVRIRLLRNEELSGPPTLEFLEENHLDAVITRPVQVPATPGVRHQYVGNEETREPHYLIHLGTR